MATAPATPIKPRRTMKEVKAPEQFKFSDQNRTLEGVYLGEQVVAVEDKDTHERKDTVQYMIEDDDGRRFTFLGLYDLQQKIRPDFIGHWMTIIYEGEDRSIRTQGNNMKKFKVGVSEEKEPGF